MYLFLNKRMLRKMKNPFSDKLNLYVNFNEGNVINTIKYIGTIKNMGNSTTKHCKNRKTLPFEHLFGWVGCIGCLMGATVTNYL